MIRTSLTTTALFITAALGFVSPLASAQGFYSWGVCAPLHSTTTAPPGSACDSACPTSTCSPACATIVWIAASCAGDKPSCGWQTVPNASTTVCRECTCDNDPINPRCIDSGHIYRTGSQTLTDCFN